MYECCICKHVCMTIGHQIHFSWCELSCGCWEFNSGLLEEQTVLSTTELTLHSYSWLATAYRVRGVSSRLLNTHPLHILTVSHVQQSFGLGCSFLSVSQERYSLSWYTHLSPWVFMSAQQHTAANDHSSTVEPSALLAMTVLTVISVTQGQWQHKVLNGQLQK